MKNMTTHALFYLREYFFPLGCGGCGEALLGAEDAYYGLCKGCRVFLNAALIGEKRCEICGRHLISERDTCLSCRERCAADDRQRYSDQLVKVRTFFPYTGKFRSILGAYKFRKSLGVGNFLARCLSTGLDDFIPQTIQDAAWVPVPPRPGKRKKQGWDQIEYLARSLEKCQALPVNRCLKRLPSRSQKELNREERENNLKGRILCAKRPPRTAIIFDDVITTGVTLNACAAALLEGGASSVYGVCLFYD